MSWPRRDDDLARLQHGDLVAQRLQAVRPRVLGGAELAGREVDERRAELCRTGCGAGAAVATMAIRNAGSRASRYDASVSVPGDTTRTTSRRTTPLALRGSSTCSQMATR